jgi:CRISPR/Cas system-associated endonuclease Cas1
MRLMAEINSSADIFHTDQIYRDSFVYNVIEAVRSDVDAWLLDFTETHVFSRTDFYETRDGGIRKTLKLTPILAETVSFWSENISSAIE